MFSAYPEHTDNSLSDYSSFKIMVTRGEQKRNAADSDKAATQNEIDELYDDGENSTLNENYEDMKNKDQTIKDLTEDLQNYKLASKVAVKEKNEMATELKRLTGVIKNLRSGKATSNMTGLSSIPSVVRGVGLSKNKTSLKILIKRAQVTGFKVTRNHLSIAKLGSSNSNSDKRKLAELRDELITHNSKHPQKDPPQRSTNADIAEIDGTKHKRAKVDENFKSNKTDLNDEQYLADDDNNAKGEDVVNTEENVNTEQKSNKDHKKSQKEMTEQRDIEEKEEYDNNDYKF